MRLDVSAEAGHACPATGFGRRYLPVGVKKKTSKWQANNSRSGTMVSLFLAILLYFFCHTQ
jgi:hypothetical protein